MLKLFRQSCSICDQFKMGFHEKEYLEAFTIMKQLVEKGEAVFFAGSCPLSQLEQHLEAEDLYTIEHYFKCKCGRIYYTGFCVRGRPILEVLDTMPKNFATTISGQYGKYFGK